MANVVSARRLSRGGKLLRRLAMSMPVRRLVVVLGLAGLIVAGCEKPAQTPKNVHTRTIEPPASSRAGQGQSERREAVDDQDAGNSREVPAASLPKTEISPHLVVERQYRPSDSRPRHNDERLAHAGIRCFESKRLRLYTDVAPQLAEPLPGLIDRAYDAWEAYFGPLPPDREKRDFQMTGYVMVDWQAFQELGLIPPDLPAFSAGRHRGAEFWIYDQKDDYYRRHLLIHEATHCFMTIIPNVMASLPWYMEGMAELFGTHAADDEGHVQFRVMPDDPKKFAGFGRIRMIQEDVRAGRLLDLADIFQIASNDFPKMHPYAWSWALCKFLDGHPRYRQRFRRIQQEVSAQEPQADFDRLFAADWLDLRDEWLLFAANLCWGYDIERTVIDFAAGHELNAGSPGGIVDIAADRGWQSSGMLVEAGRRYSIHAEGRFKLAEVPRPWESEPQGVSIRYVGGRPLGMLLATIRNSTAEADRGACSMLATIAVGRGCELTPAATGTLYFRLNDAPNELADNSGAVRVVVAAGD